MSGAHAKEPEKKQPKKIDKKTWIAVAVVLVLCIGFGSRSKANEPKATEAPAVTAAIEAVITPDPSKLIDVYFDVSTDGSNTPTITAKTNLPDGTELMFTIDGNGKTYQAESFVSNGTVTAGPFARQAEPLAGEYTLQITMSLPRLQSDSVRAVIGEKGENLTGQYVAESGFTDENVIRSSFKLAF